MKRRPKRAMLFDNTQFLTKAAELFRLDLESYTPPYYGGQVRRLWMKNFGKKFCLPGDNLVRKDLAIAKFRRTNDAMCNLNPHLSRLEPDPRTRRILSHSRYLIGSVLGEEIDLHSVYSATRHSSGASVGVSYKDTSLEAKWKPPVTATKDVLPYFIDLLQFDRQLTAALAANWDIPGLDSQVIPESREIRLEILERVKVVKGSKATTVPKTSDIDRFICVEPTVNIYLQQGLSEVMWQKMEREAGLSRQRDPERHRFLAYAGSLSNRLATIDFESMSDRVSVAACRLLFPAQWFAAFMDFRSPSTLIGRDWEVNHMISSMGNATTFPIETLVLWALMMASVAESRNETRFRTTGECRSFLKVSGVFGDDVILPTEAVPIFLDICSVLGFVPNMDKSFFDNRHFRESCGGDFLHGRDVRPLFLKAFPSPRSRIACEAHLYTMINRTIQKYISYFGPLAYVYDKRLLRFLFRSLAMVTDQIKFVPELFPEDAGVCQLADAYRLIRTYRLTPSEVSLDKHGSLRFPYLRFVSKGKPRDDDLRYAVELRRLDQLTTTRKGSVLPPPVFRKQREVVSERTTREYGKYVTRVYGRKFRDGIAGMKLLRKLAGSLSVAASFRRP